MIITLRGCTATKYLGGLDFYSIIVNKSSGVNVVLNKTTVSKDEAASTTITGTVTVSSGYTLSSVTITMGGVDKTSAWYNSSTGAITITGMTANVTITAKAVGEGGGTIDGYAQQAISYDESSWALSTVGGTGLPSISDGSSNLRLSYIKSFDIPASKIIKVVCDSAYSFAVRSGPSDNSMPNNQYWYLTDTDVTVTADVGGKLCIILRKNSTTDATDNKTATITKSDVATSKVELYFKQS